MEEYHNPFCFNLPVLQTFTEFREKIVQLSTQGSSPLAFLASPNSELLCLMGKSGEKPVLLRSEFPPEGRYPCLTTDYPAFHILERELWEETGLTPEGHPWLKPLRFPEGTKFRIEDYPFLKSESLSLHEVGVGPVHAGVIEPGHFRFICKGESVQHLEIQLGYQHRNVMELIRTGDIRHKICLAESIAGDTTIGHGLAYCLAVEAACGVKVEGGLAALRNIALELERIAMHLADLSALCGDVAYQSGLNFYAAQRTIVINSSLAICGSRYGKRWLQPGGVNYGIDKDQINLLRETLKKAQAQIEKISAAVFTDSGVQNRFDSTGSLSLKEVTELNMSGVTAKAAGLAVDARQDYPLPEQADYEVLSGETGDVQARAWLRHLEIQQSFNMIYQMLDGLEEVKASSSLELPAPQADRICVSIVEGWRGRIVHLLRTDHNGATQSYRIYDPSLHNWFGLALAVRNEGISDFPLCNKSFDLSYCGHDL